MKVDRYVFLILLTLISSCAVKQISSIKIGTDVNEVISTYGESKTAINHPSYLILVYELSDKSNYAALKFENGILVEKGMFPKWAIDSSSNSKPNSQLGSMNYYSAACRLQKHGLNKNAYNLMRNFIIQNPDSLMAITYLSHLYINDSLLDSAVIVYENAISLQTDELVKNKIRGNYMAMLIRAERYAEAESVGKILINDPETPFKYAVHYNLACIYSIQNKKEEALVNLEKIIPFADKGFTKTKLDNDSDFDNIRNEDQFKAIRSNLP